MGMRVATEGVAWSMTGWRAYSPRLRLGLPGRRPNRVSGGADAKSHGPRRQKVRLSSAKTSRLS